MKHLLVELFEKAQYWPFWRAVLPASVELKFQSSIKEPWKTCCNIQKHCEWVHQLLKPSQFPLKISNVFLCTFNEKYSPSKIFYYQPFCCISPCSAKNPLKLSAFQVLSCDASNNCTANKATRVFFGAKFHESPIRSWTRVGKCKAQRKLSRRCLQSCLEELVIELIKLMNNSSNYEYWNGHEATIERTLCDVLRVCICVV